MNISKILRIYRIEKGISQATLAKHLGYKHKSSVHYLEVGKVEWKFRDVLATCEFLGLEIEIKEK